ncbi:hypothetical protein BO78DRAFT_442710 [Aspergillus sclerotiicarbonarius CBS 121057]|uniref:Uncharacterized protein n=1 Tax=Aspergillus sclerotiicarbonarius (strain CBS 121057 / IBT 28362) TaxID=1448318 RepID=A0A319EZ86_ASPSB|nr:hypothetical protein BO78DRAFT_442710 [Aspergillus sclerotiicarbonarius CBS 121057]
MHQAAAVLMNVEFQNYLAAVQAGGNFPWGQYSKFEIPFIQQQQILAGVNRQEKLEVQKEPCVNGAAVAFFQAITSIIPNVACQWFQSGLQDTGTRQIQALLECKRHHRNYHLPQVQMQEVAEMVAWIKEFGDTPHRPWRASFSANGKELYVQIFEYADNWVRYLKRGITANADLATMHTFGPYTIGDADDMNSFSQIFVAITLHG